MKKIVLMISLMAAVVSVEAKEKAKTKKDVKSKVQADAKTEKIEPAPTAAATEVKEAAPAPVVDMTSVVGKWKTIDDETGKPKSIVEIFKDGETFKGRIVELINPKEPNPLCTKCVGDKKDQPITGMEILWGLKETEKGEEWSGGEIMDPNNGKTYKARLRLKDGGKDLEVRGFIGFSLLGRSQIWHRE